MQDNAELVDRLDCVDSCIWKVGCYNLDAFIKFLRFHDFSKKTLVQIARACLHSSMELDDKRALLEK